MYVRLNAQISTIIKTNDIKFYMKEFTCSIFSGSCRPLACGAHVHRTPCTRLATGLHRYTHKHTLIGNFACVG